MNKFDLNYEERFIQDLRSQGTNLYQSILKDKVLSYVDKNRLLLEKTISEMLEKLAADIDN